MPVSVLRFHRVKIKKRPTWADVAKLADAQVSGSCGRPYGFESLHPHQRAPPLWGAFFVGADEGLTWFYRVRARRAKARRHSPRELRLRSIGDTLHHGEMRAPPLWGAFLRGADEGLTWFYHGYA